MVGMSSSSPETPFSLYKNACDNCGKSFEHSCSYRRHLRTHCNSQTRKRRCRRLWIPDQAACSEKDEDIESMDFLDTSSECLTEGNNLLLLFFTGTDGSNVLKPWLHKRFFARAGDFDKQIKHPEKIQNLKSKVEKKTQI